MNRGYRQLASQALALLLFFSFAQGQSKDDRNVERLVKSLNDGSWLVAETSYSINYRTGYLDLTQVTLNSPRSEIGNRWYWLIYPLSNIDNLWDGDLQLFTDKAESTATSWDQVSRYVASEQRCVYMLMPGWSVSGGKIVGKTTARRRYDLGEYLRIAEIRVRKDKIAEFENFAINQMVPAANRVVPRVGVSTKAPRFIRTLRIEVNMRWEPEFREFVKKYFLPTAARTKTEVSIYHTIYGSDANYLFVFPFEKEADLAATGERVMSALWQKGHPYFKALQLDGLFAQMIIGAQETITRVRPEMSPGFNNRQARG